MSRIGVIGEYPNDISSIVNLISQKFPNNTFFPLIYDVHGSNLENQKIKHQLRREYQIEKPDYVLFIRDLDGFEENEELLIKRKEYFSEYNKVVDYKGLFLLNIWELESILLSDIETVNLYYNTQIPDILDCMKIENPKEYLYKRFQKYSTGENPILFSKIRYDKVISNCRYFKAFHENHINYFTN